MDLWVNSRMYTVQYCDCVPLSLYIYIYIIHMYIYVYCKWFIQPTLVHGISERIIRPQRLRLQLCGRVLHWCYWADGIIRAQGWCKMDTTIVDVCLYMLMLVSILHHGCYMLMLDTKIFAMYCWCLFYTQHGHSGQTKQEQSRQTVDWIILLQDDMTMIIPPMGSHQNCEGIRLVAIHGWRPRYIYIYIYNIHTLYIYIYIDT